MKNIHDNTKHAHGIQKTGISFRPLRNGKNTIQWTGLSLVSVDGLRRRLGLSSWRAAFCLARVPSASLGYCAEITRGRRKINELGTGNIHMMRNPFSHPFAKFLLKKVFFYLIVAIVALNFIFLIPRLMPGNPIDQMIPPGTTDLGR